MKFTGIDWDEGNWPKCGQHGVSRDAIEWVLEGQITVFDDPYDGDVEKRYRAIGKDHNGRFLFIAFCVRTRQSQRLIRPISARHMHRKEIEYFERQTQR